MRARRPPAHLWPAVLYVLTLAVLTVIAGKAGWVAVVPLGLVVLWRLIVMRRRAFRETSERAIARGVTGMLVVDLDGFEPADACDRLLRLAGASPGLTARLGHGRFAVTLPDLGRPERAYEVAGRLAASVAPTVVAGRLVPMTASIGVAVSGPGQLTHDLLVHRAWVAMERAREFVPQTRWAAWRESYEQETVTALEA
jgi:GGDEF domain-containing protein